MKMNRKNTANSSAPAAGPLFFALIIMAAAVVVIAYLAFAPAVEDAAVKKVWAEEDLEEKCEGNEDVVGWLQVEGTDISYPVMRGEKYLYRDSDGNEDASGSLFVEDGWSETDLCTLIYGHNMWMYGTMFHPLQRFADRDFFDRNRGMKFFVLTDGGRRFEKRTYEISHCIRTSVDEWKFADCQNICSGEELEIFLDQCGERALHRIDRQEGRDIETRLRSGELLVLSTCSYHVKGKGGRLLIVGTQKTD